MKNNKKNEREAKKVSEKNRKFLLEDVKTHLVSERVLAGAINLGPHLLVVTIIHRHHDAITGRNPSGIAIEGKLNRTPQRRTGAVIGLTIVNEAVLHKAIAANSAADLGQRHGSVTVVKTLIASVTVANSLHHRNAASGISVEFVHGVVRLDHVSQVAAVRAISVFLGVLGNAIDIQVVSGVEGLVKLIVLGVSTEKGSGKSKVKKHDCKRQQDKYSKNIVKWRQNRQLPQPPK